MDYLTYKRTFWARMLAWWTSYGENHPELEAFVSERVGVALREIDRWRPAL